MTMKTTVSILFHCNIQITRRHYRANMHKIVATSIFTFRFPLKIVLAVEESSGSSILPILVISNFLMLPTCGAHFFRIITFDFPIIPIIRYFIITNLVHIFSSNERVDRTILKFVKQIIITIVFVHVFIATTGLIIVIIICPTL